MSKDQQEQLRTAKKQIKLYADALRARGFPVKSILLYGSLAKGKAQKGSDLDVCVISPAYNSESDATRLLLWEVRRSINPLIEPIAYRPEDFDENNPLVYEIKKNGIKIL